MRYVTVNTQELIASNLISRGPMSIKEPSNVFKLIEELSASELKKYGKIYNFTESDIDYSGEYQDKWGYFRNAVLVNTLPEYTFRGVDLVLAKKQCQTGIKARKEELTYTAFNPSVCVGYATLNTSKIGVLRIKTFSLDILRIYMDENLGDGGLMYGKDIPSSEIDLYAYSS